MMRIPRTATVVISIADRARAACRLLVWVAIGRRDRWDSFPARFSGLLKSAAPPAWLTPLTATLVHSGAPPRASTC